MAFHISNIFGWKKGERRNPPRLGITERNLALNKPGAISILAAYDAQHEATSPEANVYTGKTIGTLLLRRAQSLQ